MAGEAGSSVTESVDMPPDVEVALRTALHQLRQAVPGGEGQGGFLRAVATHLRRVDAHHAHHLAADAQRVAIDRLGPLLRSGGGGQQQQGEGQGAHQSAPPCCLMRPMIQAWLTWLMP